MTPPHIEPPTVDEVCQHIRDTWAHAEPIDSWVMVQVADITDNARFAWFEERARDDLWIRAGRSFRALITPVQAKWIAAPRPSGTLAPDLARGQRIVRSLEAIPKEVRERGFVICIVAALAVPILGFPLPSNEKGAAR